MRFRLTFITGMSLLFMAAGLYLSFFGAEGSGGQRYFFTTMGILGWFIGNRIVELDERWRISKKRCLIGRTPSVPPNQKLWLSAALGNSAHRTAI
jgi:hypothetical protein